MTELRYNPKEIEPRWQEVWERERTWEVSNEPDERPSSYVLEMLPYPSGEPHIGHLKVYSVGDAVAHFHRRTGHRVLHPMGYDAFGLPAENNAIKTGQRPRDSTMKSIASFQRQFREWGVSIDWTREFATCDPEYYRWTQWIFLELYKAGLAYKQSATVNWDPVEETVLANEQVIDGRGERSGALVEARQLEQWFFRITDYADRLLDDLDGIAWPENVKTMQRNWIGRSHGAQVTFRCEEMDTDYPVFTTRPDTLFGATFFVMAPEHPDLDRLVAGTEHEDAVKAYVAAALVESGAERGDAGKTKTGVFLGRYVTNPVNGEQLPMYVADYVLMEYGTGAIMAVPAHDERDHDFAQAFGLPVQRNRRPAGPRRRAAVHGEGVAAPSRPTAADALDRIVDWLDADGRGHDRSTTACATGSSPASATGTARSRSSPVRRAAWSPCRRTSCRWCCPMSRTTSPRASPRSPRSPTGSTPPAPRAAARPLARRTRWTPSWTRRGTSCATATPTTTRPPGRPRRWPSGCPSTSTSAGSSTRSCT